MLSGLKLFTVLAVWIPLAAGQTPTQPARSSAPGTVVSVNPQSNQIVVKTDKGDLTFTTSERTQILHAAPGENDPKKWTKMSVGEIAPGDRAVAYYRGAVDQKPLLATSIVISTKADVAQLGQKELEDWKRRGTSGVVSDVNPAAHTFTIKAGSRTLTVQSGDKTVYHRYSADSAKPSDAKPSTLAEVKPGDQVNVLGNKDADGATIQAESVYAGTFRQMAATIVSIDPATGEMTVTDLATKKPLTIRVTSDSNLRKLPQEMAQMMAMRYRGGRRGGAPEGAAPNPAAGRGRGGDVGQMLDRIPAVQLADLKPKDAIMVTTTSGSDPSKVTAVNLLAGVEPILTAAPTATTDIMSGWNLGGGAAGDQ